MNSLSLLWHSLSIVGKLPNELILKIVYQYGGYRHPIVNILLNSTKKSEFEQLQKLSFGKSIYRFYLNKEKYTNLFKINIINFSNNKQKDYHINSKSYIHYEDPGYFIPRQFGRLYYTIIHDDKAVITTQQIDWSNYLNRSKKILESKIQQYDNLISRGILSNISGKLYNNIFDIYNNKNLSFAERLKIIQEKEHLFFKHSLT